MRILILLFNSSVSLEIQIVKESAVIFITDRFAWVSQYILVEQTLILQ